MASSAMIAIVMGRTRCSAPAPATASTTMIASGPYATEVSASSDSAGRPSVEVICSLETSDARSGLPTSTRHADPAALRPGMPAILTEPGSVRRADTAPGRHGHGHHQAERDESDHRQRGGHERDHYAAEQPTGDQGQQR